MESATGKMGKREREADRETKHENKALINRNPLFLYLGFNHLKILYFTELDFG